MSERLSLTPLALHSHDDYFVHHHIKRGKGSSGGINGFILPPDGEGQVTKKEFQAEERSVEIFADEDEEDGDAEWSSHVSNQLSQSITHMHSTTPTTKTTRMLKAVISALDDIDDVSEEAAVNVDDDDDRDNDDDNDNRTPVDVVVDDGLGGTVVTESIMEIVSEETNGVVVDIIDTVSADIIDTVSADIRDMAVTAEEDDNEWWGEEGDSDPLADVASLSVTIVDDDDDHNDHDHHASDDSDQSNGYMNNMNNDSINKSIIPSNDLLSSSSSLSTSSTTTTTRSVNSVESHLYHLMTKSSNNKSSCSINSNSSSSSIDSDSSCAYGNTSTIVRTISSGKQGRFNRPKYSSNPASLTTSVGLTCNLKNHR